MYIDTVIRNEVWRVYIYMYRSTTLAYGPVPWSFVFFDRMWCMILPWLINKWWVWKPCKQFYCDSAPASPHASTLAWHFGAKRQLYCLNAQVHHSGIFTVTLFAVVPHLHPKTYRSFATFCRMSSNNNTKVHRDVFMLRSSEWYKIFDCDKI